MKISCVMITAHRRDMVPKAIECFQAQTWPDRELVIYDNGDSGVKDLIPHDPRIRYYRRPSHLPDVSVGRLRNTAIDISNGDFIATWDDDDYSRYDRLAHQAKLIEEDGKARIAGYHSMYFWDARRGGQVWKYENIDDPDYAIGGSLLFEKSLWRSRPFEDVSRGEDNRFIEGQHVATASALDPLRMVARSHDRGTSDRGPGRLLESLVWQRMDAIAQPLFDQIRGVFV